MSHHSLPLCQNIRVGDNCRFVLRVLPPQLPFCLCKHNLICLVKLNAACSNSMGESIPPWGLRNVCYIEHADWCRVLGWGRGRVKWRRPSFRCPPVSAFHRHHSHSADNHERTKTHALEQIRHAPMHAVSRFRLRSLAKWGSGRDMLQTQ